MAATQPLIFFGTGALSAAVLRALATGGYAVAAAVSQPDRPAGRGHQTSATPVKMESRRLRLPCWQPPRVREILAELAAARPVAGVLFAYGQMVPSAVLRSFPRGILNLHPSLLPRYRGPSPVTQAILEGCSTTGVSIIRLDEQLDHGPVISQVSVTIDPADTGVTLLERLVTVGTEELLRVLPACLTGTATLTPQDDRQASYTKTLRREDGRIDWSNSAEAIFRQYRALQPWPGVFTEWQSMRLRLLRLSPAFHVHGGSAGTVCLRHEDLLVAGNRGSLIIRELQVAGKRALPAAEFLRGHPSFAGACLS